MSQRSEPFVEIADPDRSRGVLAEALPQVAGDANHIDLFEVCALQGLSKNGRGRGHPQLSLAILIRAQHGSVGESVGGEHALPAIVAEPVKTLECGGPDRSRAIL